VAGVPVGTLDSVEDTAFFVDCHSHVVPSGDDGTSSVRQGIELCHEAAAHGTAILFGTPHIWPHLTLTPEREVAIRKAYGEMHLHAGLELRLGFELTPHPRLLREDMARYELDGTGCVLVEVPFSGGPEVLFRVGEHIESSGFRPVIGHPERTETVLDDPGVAEELAGRGWPLQVNGTSLLGLHGPGPEELAWSFLENGQASLVASDGHRATRPPHLDEAYAAAVERLGEDAIRFFDGSALGLSRLQTPSRAASTSA
jgi:protein-tyrosine phosphatase